MPNRLLITTAMLAAAIAPSVLAKTPPPPVAFFGIDVSPAGTTLSGAKASNTTTSYGTVAATNDVLETVSGPADFASGFAGISPVKDGALTDIKFTPTDPTEFNSFSFRGQDVAADQTIEVIVQDNQGHAPETFDFTEAKAKADFARIGVVAQFQSETIKWVEIVNTGGFSDAKQFEFGCVETSKACPVGGFSGGAVPEPATWTMVVLGVGLLGSTLRRRRALARATA